MQGTFIYRAGVMNDAPLGGRWHRPSGQTEYQGQSVCCKRISVAEDPALNQAIDKTVEVLCFHGQPLGNTELPYRAFFRPDPHSR